MLAYCIVTKLSRGHLIYAAGSAEAAAHVVGKAGVEIICHALDLSRPAEELLVQTRGRCRLTRSPRFDCGENE